MMGVPVDLFVDDKVKAKIWTDEPIDLSILLNGRLPSIKELLVLIQTVVRR